MKIYKVGGCVRDMLLGGEPKDIDYVVVGSTVEYMLGQGFEQVGRDFPVFLHPHTGEEYALARIERKTAAGYNGFETHTAGVSLEEDLFRRDLTINAMAMDEKTGAIIDPYGGQADLKNRVLRHVSVHFKEDPLRVLRVARFSARYGFEIAPETIELMREVVKSQEILHINAERIWKETEKALNEPFVERFFSSLEQCGALAQVLSGVERLPEQNLLPYMPAFNQRLCHVFSSIPLQHIKRDWKIPQVLQQKIASYQACFKEADIYHDWDAQKKLSFIRNNKGLHDSTAGQEILEYALAYQNLIYRQEQKKDIHSHVEHYLLDCAHLKAIDYEKAIENAKMTQPNFSIKTTIENLQLSQLDAHLYAARRSAVKRLKP